MKGKCIDCGKKVDYRQKRCRSCYDKSRERRVRCERCGVLFKASPSQHRKYCSKGCEGLAKTGSGNHFFGKKHTTKTKDLISKANKGRVVNVGSDNPMWKGDNVGYNSLHSWIRRHKPKPEFCEHCGIKPPVEASNNSGEYKRDINDYEWLCKKCHGEKDKGWKWNEEQKDKIRKIASGRKRDNKGKFR